MHRSAILLCLATALPGLASADPVSDCRERHGADPAAHIRCLEDALRAQDPGPRPAAAPKPPVPASLGAEQAEARQRDAGADGAAAMPVEVVEVRYLASGLGVFRMADGQVWQETVATPARVRLKPGTPYRGRIERGVVGGYRLTVDGVRWLYKVERLR